MPRNEEAGEVTQNQKIISQKVYQNDLQEAEGNTQKENSFIK